MDKTDNCPCNSNIPYEQCCGRFISGDEHAPTALALMRSRYTAYTQQNNQYLLDTWHPDTRPADNPSDDNNTKWTGLDILTTEKGLEGDKEGVVEFIAHCDVKGQTSHLHEISQFTYMDDRWYYLNGQGQQPIRRESPKVGRNDPCPCGSGKKYKKCCGR